MCGIAVLAGPGAQDKARLESGVAALRHRGPDGSGTWRSPDGHVALGHTRLAIIDLSDAAAQPMVAPGGRSAITFNGEIYNFRELASRTGPLRSHSDTEVLLHLLRDEGALALARLRGMFAFAWWNGEELLIARDPLGIKPLFWAETRGGRFAAASEIAPLLAMGVGTRRTDPVAIDQYLTYLYVPSPRTALEGISELPPAHVLRWRPGRGAEVSRYWRPPCPRGASVSPGEVRSVLAEAVAAHLVADVPVGVFLSGGLDSSAVVALAASRYAGRLKTFTVTFGGEGDFLDERRFAREVASRYGTDHTEIPVRADVARILPELVKHFGQPFGNPTSVLTYALSEATRRHVKVVLAGDGGDEVLGGYPRYQGVWAAEAYSSLPRPVKSVTRAVVERLGKNAARGRVANRAVRFVRAGGEPPEERYFRWVTYLDDGAKAELLVDRHAMLGASVADREWQHLWMLREACGAARMRDTASYIDLGSFLPSNVLAYGDRMSMAHSLEARVPFCDHRVVERLASLPLAWKMPGGIPKGLFRWALRHDLPPAVSLHRKMGFNPPMAEWLRRDLRVLLDDHLGEGRVSSRGLFKPSAVRRMTRSFIGGDGSAALTLWSLVVLEEWQRWLESLPPSPWRWD